MNSELVARRQKLFALMGQVEKVDLDSLTRHFVHHLEYSVGKYKANVSGPDIYRALALTVRDFLVDRFNETQEEFAKVKSRRVYYLSMEFLIGRLLENNLVNLGMRDTVAEALSAFGYDLNEVVQYEPEAGLGNGGLGRLAACFLDSMMTLDLPCYGACLRYEFGIFNQQIVGGYQKEAPDMWLTRGNPWEIQRDDIVFPVQFYGYCEKFVDSTGETRSRWQPGETVMAMAHDILIPGFNTRTVNNLRLWSAGANAEFNIDYFNHGDYVRAIMDKVNSKNITRVLYPNENVIQGRELRLKQEYFLVSSTLQDALKTFFSEESDIHRLPERVFFQLNDTHPALAVAELIRLLVDDYDIGRDLAWQLTKQCMAYTNHTVMPEALERWDLDLFERLLPRHLEIIYEINHEFLEELRKKGIQEDKIRNMSIIEEGPVRRVRMANLAVVGATAVNGVSALHSELIKTELFRDFAELWPHKFQNKTNGITPRRWIVASNPDLTALISAHIGRDWILDLDRLRELEKLTNDAGFRRDWMAVKRRNKELLGEIIRFECGVNVDPGSLFDVQVKRIHEYKRQLLNVLRLIAQYQKIKANPAAQFTPRTAIFAGKAAPGYWRAKLIIKLINCVADVVNHDSDVADRLKVVFLPNFRVSLGERIYPAADLSEQISTAGTEASGTGNMKFMLNGALTVGTLDGANVEILEEAGRENVYIFGMTVEQIRALQREHRYNPVGVYETDTEIAHILNAIRGDFFNKKEPGLFQEIFHSLTYGGDQYYLLADYRSYEEVQQRIDRDFQDVDAWARRSILNTARSGAFSSDRTIRDYARDIWKVAPQRQREPRIHAI